MTDAPLVHYLTPGELGEWRGRALCGADTPTGGVVLTVDGLAVHVGSSVTCPECLALVLRIPTVTAH